MDQIDSIKPRYYISSLAKGLACLQAFTSKPEGLTLSQIARYLNLDPATASRVCHTLIDLGFLHRDGAKKFNLTPRVLTLGYSYLSSLPNSPFVHHCLVELFSRLNEPVSLGVLDAPDVVYLVRIPKIDFLPFDIGPGARLPAYCTALGKAILAYSTPELVASVLRRTSYLPLTAKTITSAEALMAALNTVRDSGYACNDEELYLGSRAVAAPILDRNGCAVAAISLPLPTSRYTLDQISERIVPHVIKAAKEISFVLQGVEDPFHLGVRSAQIVRSE